MKGELNMKCLLQETDVLNKRVIVRCDFNVPVKDGHILDDTKIKASLETINYLIDKNINTILFFYRALSILCLYGQGAVRNIPVGKIINHD